MVIFIFSLFFFFSFNLLALNTLKILNYLLLFTFIRLHWQIKTLRITCINLLNWNLFLFYFLRSYILNFLILRFTIIFFLIRLKRSKHQRIAFIDLFCKKTLDLMLFHWPWWAIQLLNKPYHCLLAITFKIGFKLAPLYLLKHTVYLWIYIIIFLMLGNYLFLYMVVKICDESCIFWFNYKPLVIHLCPRALCIALLK